MPVDDLIARARAGDEDAFARAVAPLRQELHVHCYRVLGSEQDAEDALQEAMLAAWQGLAGFDGRASLRTWLYRIATNRCLNMLRSTSRRPRTAEMSDVLPPTPSRLGEVSWLEPYPDFRLDVAAGDASSPEARYEMRESISLAFMTAIQLLPARQRAVVILRDVLGFHIAEIAEVIGSTEQSVKSALKRARATLDRVRTTDSVPPPPLDSAAERELVERFVRAYEAADLHAVIDLLTDDVSLTMPPLPFVYEGKADAARFLEALVFQPGHGIRLIPTRANGQPAFGFYVGDPTSGLARAIGLLVLSLAGTKIGAITRFESSCLPRFGLPRSLPL